MCLFVLSCRKEQNTISTNKSLTPFFENIDNCLRDSLSKEDYKIIDLNKAVLSQFDEGEVNFLRIPLSKERDQESFIILKTNSLSKCIFGSITSITNDSSNNFSSNTIYVFSLNRKVRKLIKTGNILNEHRNVASRVVPSGNYLPPVTVTCYISSGSNYSSISNYSFYDLMNIDNQYYTWANGQSVPVSSVSGSGGFTYYSYYAPLEGGVQRVDFDAYAGETGEDINKIFNCFSSISDIGATYSLKLCADVPDNNKPLTGLDDNLHPGHTFLTLTKTNGAQSITKAFGFYPTLNWKSVFFQSETSKLVNDGKHEINASVEMSNLTQADFNLIKNKAITNAAKQYDLDDFNCSDFALDIFNVVRPTNPITLNPFLGVVIFGVPPVTYSKTIKNTPQMLYKKLFDIWEDNPAANPAIKINTQGTYRAPVTTGGCN